MRRILLLAIGAAALCLAGCVEKLDFGTVFIGASNTKSVFWKNTSGAPQTLTLSPIAGASDFTVEGASQTNLQPHESTSIAFTFRPSAPGVREASCRVTATIENNMPFAARTVEVEYRLRGVGLVRNSGAP